MSEDTKIENMLNTLSWMSIRQRIAYNCCILVHKMKNKIMPDYLSGHIIKQKHNYNTREKSLLKIRHTRAHTEEKSIIYLGFRMYNKLPEEIKEENNIISFKKLLRNYVKTNVQM